MPETLTATRESTTRQYGKHVSISVFASEAEQRRLRMNRAVIGYVVTAPKMTQVQHQALEDFYKARDAELESFYFVCPYSGVTHLVRFVGNLDSSYKGGIYRANYRLKVLTPGS